MNKKIKSLLAEAEKRKGQPVEPTYDQLKARNETLTEQLHQAYFTLLPFAKFAEIHQEQRKGSLVPKTGEIYTVCNRAGEASICVEHVDNAQTCAANIKVLL